MNEVSLVGSVVNTSKAVKIGSHKKCMFNLEIKRTRELPSVSAKATMGNPYDYPRVIAFDDVAVSFVRKFKRGDVVKVTGWIHVAISNTDGHNSYFTEIIAEKIELYEEEASYESI